MLGSSTPRHLVQQRMLAVGTFLVAVGAQAGISISSRGFITTAHFSLAILGIELAALPTDVHDWKRNAAMMCSILMVTVMGAVKHVTLLMASTRQADGARTAWISGVISAGCVTAAVVTSAVALRPRRGTSWRQEQVWRTMGIFSIGLWLLGTVLSIAPRTDDGRGLAWSIDDVNGWTQWWRPRCVADVLTAASLPINVVCAWLALSVNVRIRLRAQLGWSISERASAMAAQLTAIGAGIPHLRAHALSRFRYVTADVLAFSAFASHERDPSLLELATSSTELHDIDAFVSRTPRCRPHPSLRVPSPRADACFAPLPSPPWPPVPQIHGTTTRRRSGTRSRLGFATSGAAKVESRGSGSIRCARSTPQCPPRCQLRAIPRPRPRAVPPPPVGDGSGVWISWILR